ncbi:heparinase II/III family protein [Aquibacillus albus]|uniref:Heparinase superfamily protein n=1 Tax=Aquibacillus albus TaxID=1168171 RepID=A0ABS2MZP1_9BACI|nr:alginate lyase family protein [Aquibacillus albus]MBM7571374.1 putative heparinase superfamily protein [Aquibacillus albus]
MDNKITLFVNTVKYLKPSQIYYRVFNRLKRELYTRKLLSVKIPTEVKVREGYDYIIPEIDFDKEYLERFDVDDIFKDKFTFINLTNQIELSKAWNNKELQHLWRYNLHYFEYLFKLAYEFSMGNNQTKYYEKYRDMIKNWINNNPYAYGDGWHPYTISLRLTNWIATYRIFEETIKLDREFDKTYRESLFLQYQYLQANLEKDVLGNHYFENIKALIIGSVFFEDTKIKEKFKRELFKQLMEQILEDGMHFELSPMYHKIILEDLIKITYWLKDEEIYDDLIFYIQKMIDVTYSFEKGFGKTPAFNDSADGVSKDFKALLETCSKYFGLVPVTKTIFEESGFYIIKDSNKKLILDTGEICPTYLPAHGHCDALSFELSIKGVPFIVNSGTYQYENGQWRDYFRSTKAHNTISISDQEQSQFWGSFRVAKRINKVSRKQFLYKNIQFYAGSYVSYTGDQHKRYIGYLDENTIIILDYVNDHMKDNIKSYLHFAPETRVEIKGEIVQANKGSETIKLAPIGINNVNVKQGWYSEQFNAKENNKHLVFHKEKNRHYFGYLIGFNSTNYKVKELDNGIKITGDKELIINYEELGVML